MLVTPSGIIMLVILLQFLNALSPMPATLYPSMIEGIIISVSVQLPIPVIVQVV